MLALPLRVFIEFQCTRVENFRVVQVKYSIRSTVLNLLHSHWVHVKAAMNLNGFHLVCFITVLTSMRGRQQS